MTTRRRPRLRRVLSEPSPPVWLVVVGIFGPARRGDRQEPVRRGRPPTLSSGCGWSTSAVVLARWSRARRCAAVRRHDWRVVVAFGVASGTMNWAIYQSFARIPLGIAVTIEFLGPLEPRRRRQPPGARPGLGRCWPRLGVALLGLERGDLTCAGVRSRCSPAPRGRRTSCSARRPAAAGPGSTGWRSPAWWPRCCSRRSLLRLRRRRPRRRARPAAGRRGRPAELGDPLLLRDHRAAHDAGRRSSAS